MPLPDRDLLVLSLSWMTVGSLATPQAFKTGVPTFWQNDLREDESTSRAMRWRAVSQKPQDLSRVLHNE